MLAAAHALRIQGPRRMIVAVPVASHEACEEFRHMWIRLSAPKRQSRSAQ
jgi:predicted phosphoribosyltransferase